MAIVVPFCVRKLLMSVGKCIVLYCVKQGYRHLEEASVFITHYVQNN